MKKFLASVGNAQLLGQNGEHIADVHTLTESSLSFSTTMEDVRAGTAAKLYGRFAHTTSMTATLTDAMFDMNYIAYQVGEDNEIGGYVMTTEATPITVGGTSAAKTLTLQNIPTKIGEANGLSHIVVWYKKPDQGNNSYQWKSFIADATQALTKTVTFEDASVSVGDKVCVRYFRRVTGDTAHTVRIKADFFPAEMVLLLTTKLYAGESANVETGKPIGYVTVKIPRFQLDGAFDLSMAMTSAASVSLSGSALAVADGSCDESGVYAEIVEIVESSDEFANLNDLMIADAANYKVGDVVTVYGNFDGTAAIMDNNSIIFDDTYLNNTAGHKGECKQQTSGTFQNVTMKVVINEVETSFADNIKIASA